MKWNKDIKTTIEYKYVNEFNETNYEIKSVLTHSDNGLDEMLKPVMGVLGMIGYDTDTIERFGRITNPEWYGETEWPDYRSIEAYIENYLEKKGVTLGDNVQILSEYMYIEIAAAPSDIKIRQYYDESTDIIDWTPKQVEAYVDKSLADYFLARYAE